MSDKKIELPSMLAFERKLEVSDALMYAGNWGDVEKDNAWHPITISPTPRTGRGTESHYLEDKHDEKCDPNPFEGDSAFLPPDKNTLKVSFTLGVVGNLGKPFSCNNSNFEKDLKEKIDKFKGEDGTGLEELAFRYAYNIANGRFLWRNRVCAEKIKIYVVAKELESVLDFSAYDFSLDNFNKSDDQNLDKLRKLIQKGLNGKNENGDYVFLKVIAYVKLGEGRQVFPSQEMNTDDKKKTLFRLNENQAAMHSVKIGNAIRTIDTWYGDKVLVLTGKKKPKTEVVPLPKNERFPIAIEPYGAVTHKGSAYHYDTNDLYTLLPKWVGGEAIEKNCEYFIVANLIRGGLFNGKSDKKED